MDNLGGSNRNLNEGNRIPSTQSFDSSYTDGTQHSQGSSVIINKREQNSEKPDIRHQVMEYLRTQKNEFNTTAIFKEREHAILKQISDDYNLQDETDTNNKVESFSDDYEVSTDKDITLTAITSRANGPLFDEFESYLDDFKEDQINEDDEFLSDGDDTALEDSELVYADGDDLLMYSPPRSPPKEIDPSRLYGLYDFSGPDPQHCTISRDEPVYLINDEDSYWWLVRKLSKEERISYRQSFKSKQYIEEHGVGLDEDDGKIGFVPAECLETYGERLARLNCFKNEELERNQSVDMTIHTEGDANSASNSKRVPSIGKSVSFEPTIMIDEDEEDSEPEDTFGREGNFGPTYSQVISEDLKHLSIDSHDDEKSTEILSDIFPQDTPLIVSKNHRNLSKREMIDESSQPSLFQALDIDGAVTEKKNLSKNFINELSVEEQVTAEQKYENQKDRLKSPPPKVTKDVSVFSGGTFKRSEIMDKLNQVTFDIKEQLNVKNSDSNSDKNKGLPLDIDYGSEDDISETESKIENTSSEEIDVQKVGDRKSIDNNSKYVINQNCDSMENYKEEIAETSNEVHASEEIENLDSASNSKVSKVFGTICLEDSDYMDTSRTDFVAHSPSGSSITPLTSSHSLNNASKFSLDSANRDNSVMLHDIFLPVMGKFDEFADKLAELERLL